MNVEDLIGDVEYVYYDVEWSQVRDNSDRDPDMIHLIHPDLYRKGGRIALCGFDCSSRQPRKQGTGADCVVCLDLEAERRRLE
jgi:hypothetical protein